MRQNTRKTFLIRVEPGQDATGDLRSRRSAAGRAYRQLARQLKPLRQRDPQMLLHPNRQGATLPIFVVETLLSLKPAIRALPGVRSVTPAAPIHRIA